MYDGDGMGVSVSDTMEVYKSLKKSVETAPSTMSNVVPFPKGLTISRKRSATETLDPVSSYDKQIEVLKETAALQQKLSEPSVQKQLLQPLANLQRFQSSPGVIAVNSIDELDNLEFQQQQQAQQRWNPADIVAAKLSEAAAAASSAALQPLATAAGSLYAGFVSSAFSAPSDRVASAAIAGIASAEVAASHPNSKEVKAASTSGCPSEWFVVDDDVNTIRYFVIQGSDSIDHWRTNITFEPMMFEGLGIKVGNMDGRSGSGGWGGPGRCIGGMCVYACRLDHFVNLHSAAVCMVAKSCFCRLNAIYRRFRLVAYLQPSPFLWWRMHLLKVCRYCHLQQVAIASVKHPSLPCYHLL